MLISDYLLTNPDWDIYDDSELEFAEPSSHDEAVANMQWVLDNEPDLQALGIVVCSYYGDTIDWGRL